MIGGQWQGVNNCVFLWKPTSSMPSPLGSACRNAVGWPVYSWAGRSTIWPLTVCIALGQSLWKNRSYVWCYFLGMSKWHRVILGIRGWRRPGSKISSGVCDAPKLEMGGVWLSMIPKWIENPIMMVGTPHGSTLFGMVFWKHTFLDTQIHQAMSIHLNSSVASRDWYSKTANHNWSYIMLQISEIMIIFTSLSMSITKSQSLINSTSVVSLAVGNHS